MRFTVALVFMMAVNIMLFLFQNSMTSIDVSAPVIYNDSNSPYSAFVDTNNHKVYDRNLSDLPDSATGDQGTQGVFSDLFNTLKSWISKAVGVGKIVWQVVTAMPTFLDTLASQNMIPPIIAGIFGGMWTVITLILVVSWLRWNF